MSAQFDDDFEWLRDSLPDRLERGQDGVDLSRIEPGVGLVYTGLGGEGQRLRYIVVAGVQYPPLDVAAYPALEVHWQESAHMHHAKLEALTIATDHVQVTLLISMDIAPDDVVQAGLRWQWAGQQCLNPEYYILKLRYNLLLFLSIYSILFVSILGVLKPVFICFMCEYMSSRNK